jgi:hypothetical protein
VLVTLFEAHGLLGFRTRLGASAARDVRLLALRGPATTRDLTVIETDEVTQCVELRLIELARVADAQAVKRQVRERHALQLVDEVTERLDHPMNLAVLALVNRDREPRVLALAWQHLDFGGHRDRAVVELDAVAQQLDVVGRELGVHLHVIRLGHVARRCEQSRREVTVVRQQQHALGVEVEPTDGLHRHRQVRQVVHHHRPTTVIGHRRDACLRLVEDHVEVVERHDGLAVHGHGVVLGVDLRTEYRDHLAVDGHPSVRDQILSLAPRRDTRRSEETLQSYWRCHGATLR